MTYRDEDTKPPMLWAICIAQTYDIIDRKNTSYMVAATDITSFWSNPQDSLKRNVLESISDEKVRYAYNNGGKVISEANASNQVTANYVWGPDRLLAKRDVSTNKKYYYLYNGHGDVVQIIDESGNIVNNYQYDEWGNILQQQERIDNAFKYAGEIQDEETGLYYLRARYYDPSVGRFISKDTYEGQINNPLSLNLYTYVINDPVNNVDPTGNYCEATVNGKFYSHPGKCATDKNGKQINKGSKYIDDKTYIKNLMNQLLIAMDTASRETSKKINN
ncbi:RHS repeat-associated protein [Fontibacillus solani]|uniref:RHS repeat-associated protein n=1 Tax=Fontibacillus solani TaxID=1572857 RepID=A0A7W3XT48_9BACL|nr:RHS repeat-associated core domain-containing protein [Fontibacillus solani]MBA9087229.1 RHS repeat-associated protein [Fontibacillus solani]